MKSPNTVRAVVERKFDLKEMSAKHIREFVEIEEANSMQHRHIAGVTGAAGSYLRHWFVKAWAQIVRYHRELYKKGFRLGDPGLCNMLYHPQGGYGVLGNFDLSPTPSSSFPSASAEGIGTIQLFNAARVEYVPFMSLELLKEDYWKGKIPRRYQHELEAPIWILLFVLLSYDDKALGMDYVGAHSCVTSDYSECRKEKGDFLSRAEFVVQGSHQAEALGLALIIWVHAETSSRSRAAYMQRLLSLLSRSEGTQELTATKKDRVEEDQEVWKTFTGVIRSLVARFPEFSDVADILT